jgi:5-methyltetrahydropteroyltriglutamate--homocysteine methyltransferase
MVGSYPRPLWYDYQLLGRDLLDAFKWEEHHQAWEDATTAVIAEQERAGLDIVTDGQMHFDDYGGSIGSFVWYWYERIPGFFPHKLPNPLNLGDPTETGASEAEIAMWHNWGGTKATEKVHRGLPSRLVEMYQHANRVARRPVKVSVGAGPPNLGFHVDFKAPDSAYSDQRQLAEDLVPIFNAELKELVAAGAEYIQLEDLGGWLLTPDNPGAEWVIDVMNGWVDGVDAKLAWHCCLGTGYGNSVHGLQEALPLIIENMYRVNVEQLVLDFAQREMKDVSVLKGLPADKEIQAGVIDVRTLQIETDNLIVDRIGKLLEVVQAEQLYLSTDCGLRALPRFCANEKIRALSRAAARVRAEL